MKKFLALALLFFAVSFFANAQDYKAIAGEYCNCFQKIKDTMNVEFQDLIIRISKEKDVKKAFNEELQKLTPEKIMLFSEQLTAVGTEMDAEDSEAGKCGSELDDKYRDLIETPEKEKVFTNKMADEMNKVEKCKFIAAIIIFASAFSQE